MVLLVCSWLPAVALAGVDEWTPIGPQGATLADIVEDAVDPSVLYADDGTVLYRSSDGGTSWQATLPHLFCGSDGYFFPHNGFIYVLDCGVLTRSGDGGNTWEEDLPPPPDGLTIAASDPTNPQVVYGFTIFTGAVKSEDGGATWIQLPTGVPPSGWTGMLVDAQSPSTVYIFGYAPKGFGVSGVLRSTDGGARWSAANTGLPGDGANALVRVGSQLVAATVGGIFKSADAGANWTAAKTDLSAFQLGRLAVSSGPSPVVYVLSTTTLSTVSIVFRSEDGGDTWTQAGTLPFAGDLLVSSQSPSTLFALTDQGLAISRDGAATWTLAPPTNGLPSAAVPNVLIDSGGSVLYANVYSGFGSADSIDHGQHWSPLGLVNGTSVKVLSLSRSHAATVYGQQCDSGGCDVYRSANSGQDWLALPNLPAELIALLEAPHDASVLYAAGNRGILLAPPRVVGSAPFVLRSTDGGANWVEASSGLPTALADPGLRSLAIDPTDGNTLYAGVNATVFKTTDGGAHWAAFGTGLPNGTIETLLIDPQHPAVIYAAIGLVFIGPGVSGVYVSTDAGATWSPRNQGLDFVTVSTLAIDPNNSSALYVGTFREGLFRSTDTGLHWKPMSSGFKTSAALKVNAIAVDPNDSHNLYVGTDDGAFALTIAAYGSIVPVIEFYTLDFDHYFMAAEGQADVAALDSGTIPDWLRTEQSFKAYPAPAPGTSPVCRYYIPPEFGDSHFFSASPAECTAVQQRFPQLVLETPTAFYVALPDQVTGACAAGTIPVFRLWNGRVDSNHRYTSDPAIKVQMIAKGYVAEGYGPDQVAMCAPQ